MQEQVGVHLDKHKSKGGYDKEVLKKKYF
jgi:hypothetical protein